MKMRATFILLGELAFISAVIHALPVHFPPAKREVPQEHSHQATLTSVTQSLQLNNPDGITDPVFALLGDAAAKEGAGKITDVACLQQAVADHAFTNAKAANDVEGMTNALIFRTLERNTGAVGEKSALCTSLQAVNPEIAALTQHQDPASDGAAANNKQVALDLAVQIANIGGDPQSAIQSGTFKPGTIGDPTAKGFTCDNATDPVGCILSQNLLVPDVTAEEINSAVAAAGATSVSSSGGAIASSAPASIPTASTASAPASSSSPSTSPSSSGSCSANTGGSSSNNTSTPSTTTSSSSSSASITASTSTPSSSTLDLGQCSGSPFIVFGAGFDGRSTDSFEPADEATFNHGSALNIAVIAEFICQQLQDKCKASQATLTACNNGLEAATASGVTGQAAADAFNAALQ